MLQAFLNSLRQQKEIEIWQYQSSANGKDASIYKSELSVLITQRNLIALIESLPVAVKAIEDNIERQRQQAASFAAAQE